MDLKNSTIMSFNKTCDIPINFTGICNVVEPSQTRWYKNGIRHRLNGPAVIRHYNENSLIGITKSLYFIDGINLTKKEYWEHPLVIKAILDKIIEL